MRTHGKGLTSIMFAGAALLLVSSLGMAATGTTPVQAAGGGASADEYAKKSDLGFQWSGDVRERLDVRDRSTAPTQVRFRTRLRVGAKGTFGDKKAFWGFKLATGSADPVSRNLTLGGGDANGAMDFGLDQAYLGLMPHPKVKVTVGKMGNPFDATEAILDGDLTPPGVAVEWDIFKGEQGDTFKNVKNTLAYYFIRDIGAATDDPYAIFEQLNADAGPVELGASLYYFGNLNSRPQPAAPAALIDAAAMGQAGANLLATRAFPSNEMAVISGKARYPFKIGTFPMAVRGEIFANVSETDLKQFVGYEVKLEFPKLGSNGKGHILGRDVGQFATFSPWADSDLGEGTGYKSALEIEYQHKLTKNVSMAFSFFHFDRFQPATVGGTGSGRHTNRYFVDISTKF